MEKPRVTKKVTRGFLKRGVWHDRFGGFMCQTVRRDRWSAPAGYQL